MTKTKYHFVSLGCPKNLVDSQVMLGRLAGDNYELTQEPAEAEVIIVNTCSFVGDAKEESINALLEMARFKDEGRCRVLVAAGCLPQRYSHELAKEMPEVDLLVGTGQYHRIAEFLRERIRALESDPKHAQLPPREYIDQPAFIHSEKDNRVLTGARYTAYLKISEGCNRRCAFCIIPTLRGNVRSRSIASLLEEARGLAAQGVRELNLVAQDLTEYGMEHKYQERLEMLLPELCKLDGIDWIRLHYVYPDEFSDELVELIAREPKIVKYLDMPIQHTSDRILKAMNRRLSKSRLFDLVAKLRARVPGLVFRTSIIVGFPGETEDDFQELCADLKRLELDHVGVFEYSREEGTRAATMPEQVRSTTRKRRARELTALLEDISYAKKQALLGRELPVLIEGESEEGEFFVQARLSTQAQDIDGHVLINDTEGDGEALLKSLKPGDMAVVRITQAMPHDLLATLLRKV